MIPIAIEGGFILGLWIRWWALPVVAVGWVVALVFFDPSSALAGGALGVANALAGVLPAVALRRMIVKSMRAPRAGSRQH